jgi:hypothetical protein
MTCNRPGIPIQGTEEKGNGWENAPELMPELNITSLKH